MSNLHPQLADSFCEEMEKMAGFGGAAATLGTIGGLIGAGTGYSKAKARGEDTKGALLGAAKGGLVGGALGAGAGAGAAGLSSALRGGGQAVVTGAGKMPWYKTMDRSLSDFGKRQIHALTGWVPKEGLTGPGGIGIGGRDPAGVADAAVKLKEKLEAQPAGGVVDKVRLWRARRGAVAEQAALDAHNKLMQHGATSIPGFAKAMVDPTARGDVLRASGSQLWHGGGTTGKLMLGAGALGVAHGAVGAPGPGEEGMGRGERIGRGVGQMAGFALPGTVPIAGQLVGGEVLSQGLGRVGKLFDRPRVVPPPPRMIHDPTDPVASTERQTGREVMMSPSAQGKSFGGGME